jgi:hypothetical protein
VRGTLGLWRRWPRYNDTRRQGVVSDDGGLCRVRAGDGAGTSPRRAQEGQERGQEARQASPVAPELEKRIRAALDAPGRTEGIRKIAERLGVIPGTVQRISRPFEQATVGG